MENKKLKAYTKALLLESAFREQHKKLFEELNSLQYQISETEAELKEEVKINLKTNIANEFVKVTYSPAYKKFYNFDVIMEQTTPSQKKALENANAIIRTLDKSIFENLVEQGIIPVEIKQAAFEETEMTPRVSIKEVKPK